MASSKSDLVTEAFKLMFAPSRQIKYAIVDAFTENAFGGNPAAVVHLSEWKDDKWLQNVAAEFNLSETAYIVKKETRVVDGGEAKADEGEGVEVVPESNRKQDSKPKLVFHDYDLRWFTPKKEVDLCGHATLAPAHLLFHIGLVGKEDTIFFHTKSGLLSARCVGPEDGIAQTDADGAPKVELVELNFPWITTTPSPLSAVQALPGSLKDLQVVAAGKAAGKLIVELASKEDLEKLKPDFQELLDCDSDGLIVTAPGGPTPGFDFVSRCFFPKAGINEDPVTGSAHSVLGPYWSTKLGKENLLAYQLSTRGGTLALRMDKKIGRVYIRGEAVVVMAGVLVKL